MAIKEIEAKTLLSSRTKPDSWFGCKYNMNIYRGCQHQCIYCDSRSECYQIRDFEDVLVKVNAVERLKDELPRKRKKGTVCFGAMSDCYSPIEAKYKLVRQCLEVIVQHRYPIHMMTKSDMVLRDKDLYVRISDVYAAVSFTITAADDDLARKVEPGAPVSSKRFAAMRELADAGVYVGVTMMPILPFIEDTDENIAGLIEKAAESGAKYIIPWFGMTLRDRQRDYYYRKLDELFPGLKERYQRECGCRYGCDSPRAKELDALCRRLCEKHGISLGMEFYKGEPETGGEQGVLI